MFGRLVITSIKISSGNDVCDFEKSVTYVCIGTCRSALTISNMGRSILLRKELECEVMYTSPSLIIFIGTDASAFDELIIFDHFNNGVLSLLSDWPFALLPMSELVGKIANRLDRGTYYEKIGDAQG